MQGGLGGDHGALLMSAGSEEASSPGSCGEAADATCRAKVLIVDDEPEITEMLGEYLSIQGFAVTAANSGGEALMRLEIDRPDAILLDVRMPTMDGIETLKRIQAKDTGARVLMVSANDDVDVAKAAIGLGAFDYLLKPVDFGYLSRALEQVTRPPASRPTARGLASVQDAPDEEPVSCYDLALEICRVARDMGPASQRPVARPLQRLALRIVRMGPGSSRRNLVRDLGELRTLLRFAKDLGDISDDVHRCLESHLVRARRGLGMS